MQPHYWCEVTVRRKQGVKIHRRKKQRTRSTYEPLFEREPQCIVHLCKNYHTNVKKLKLTEENKSNGVDAPTRSRTPASSSHRCRYANCVQLSTLTNVLLYPLKPVRSVRIALWNRPDGEDHVCYEVNSLLQQLGSSRPTKSRPGLFGQFPTENKWKAA